MGSQTLAPTAQTLPQKAPNSPSSLRGDPLFQNLRLSTLIVTMPQGDVRWTPHPVIVTIVDNEDYIRVLLYTYYTTIKGWGGVLLNEMDEYTLTQHAKSAYLIGVVDM